MVTADAQQAHDESDTVDQLPSRPASPLVRIDCGGLSHRGLVRSNNEDQFLVARLAKSMKICQSSLEHDTPTHFSEEDGYLLVVADGMGGAAAGERASALAVESIQEFALNSLKWFLHVGRAEESELVAELRKGLEVADQAVFDEAEDNPRLRGMGTTLTLAFSVGRDLYIVHAGDSRAYLQRGGVLEQITRDHTLVQLLVRGGALSAEAAKHHARRNVVTNVLGGPTAGVHAEIHKVRIEHDDILLLCSDGLSEPVDERQIAEILGTANTATDATNRLISRALENGGPDNVTAIVARFLVDDRGPTTESPRHPC